MKRKSLLAPAACLLFLLVPPAALAESVIYPPRYLRGVDRLEPWELLAEDFSGDGISDLAVLHTGGVAFLLNDGTGDFEESDPVIDAAYAWPQLRGGIVKGDWNADGHQDMAAVFLHREVKIVLGNGDGTFVEGGERMLDGVQSLAAADFNGDGADDLFLSFTRQNPVERGAEVLLSQGDATFDSTPLQIPFGQPGTVAVLRGQSTTYLVLGCIEDGGEKGVFFAASNGDGTFEPWITSQVFGGWGTDFRACDVDGDGSEELLLFDKEETAATRVAIGKVEPDFVVSDFCQGTEIADAIILPERAFVAESSYDALELLQLGPQQEILAETTYSSGGMPWCLAAADFNADGVTDVAVGLYGALWHDDSVRGCVTLCLAEGSGLRLPQNAAPAEGLIRNLELFDLDGDQDLDALVSVRKTGEDTLSELVVLRRTGGFWEEHQRVACRDTLAELQVGDLNEDGIPDLVGCESMVDHPPTDSLWVFLGQGDMHFADPVPVSVGESPVAAQIADLDGDGHLDVVAVLHGCYCYPANESFLAVLRGQGDGTFQEPLTVPAGHYGTSVQLAELNGDSHLDAIVACHATLNEPGASVFLGSAGGGFERVQSREMNPLKKIVVGDVDGDGEREVLFGGAGIYVCEIVAGGLLGEPRAVSLTFEGMAVALGDVTGDGVPDILGAESKWVHAANDRLSLFEGKGGGSFPDEPRYVDSGLGTVDIWIKRMEPDTAPVVCTAGALFEHRTNFLVSLPLSAFGAGEGTIRFQRSDANDDSATNLSDAVFVLDHLFLGGPAPSCLKSADSNDSGSLELTDAIYVLNFLFLGGPSPPAPFSDCGIDPSEDDLTCMSFTPCEG